jgi:Polyketide cyclase / dehydrase and lipid transport
MDDPDAGHPDIHWPSGFTPREADCYYHARRVVRAPAQRLFALVTDVASWPTWVPGVPAVQLDDTAARGLRHLQTFEFTLHGLQVEALVGEYLPYMRLGWSGVGAAALTYRAWLFLEFPHGTEVVTELVARGPAAQAMRERPPVWMEEQGRRWLAQLRTLAEG